MKLQSIALSLTAACALLAVPAMAADYQIDGGHSSAVFKIKHFGTSNFYGVFRDIEGTLSYDAANPSASAIQLTIQANSVDSRHGKRDDHIRSADFLNAGEFPTITFKSTKISGSADELQVTGNLTLHGISQEITFTAEKTGEGKHPRSGNELLGFEARFQVKRTDFDMNYMVGPLSDEIDFLVALEAVKQ